MDYLKYLPLLGIAGAHPQLVILFNQIATMVQPHVPEIEQAINEVEAMLKRINPPIVVTK